MYGSGFPKSLDISKAIDKFYGIETSQREILNKNPNFRESHLNPTNVVPMVKSREIIGIRKRHGGGKDEQYMGMTHKPEILITKPMTPEAKQWEDWGTGLKPAHEPIVLAQKPCEGTYAENILKWGVGGLNIDACRIDYIPDKEVDSRIYNRDKNITRGHHENATLKYAPDGNEFPMFKTLKGRWPTNLILDEVSAKMIDEQSGNTTSSKGGFNRKHQKKNRTHEWSQIGSWNTQEYINNAQWHNDKGGASRFFYCAKAYKKERNQGCEDLYWEKINDDFKKIAKKKYDLLPSEKRAKGNPISTLKPINLMRYLVRLVTPLNGFVLDPFAGSGTTGIACIIENFNYILIEKRKPFAEIIIPKRLKWWEDPNHWKVLKDYSLLPKIQIKIKEKKNMSLEAWA
jgi:site-specific DNA-methyltransferase (adenine-specific)